MFKAFASILCIVCNKRYQKSNKRAEFFKNPNWFSTAGCYSYLEANPIVSILQSVGSFSKFFPNRTNTVIVSGRPIVLDIVQPA